MSDDSKQLTPVARRKPPSAGRGRKKGELNKTTRAVKEALSIAFEEAGGTEKLSEWAQANRTEFYKLWAKMLPLQVAGDPNAPLSIVVKWETGG